MANERDAVIWVTARQDSAGAVTFTHDSTHLKNGKLTFESPIFETYNMMFILQDETKYDLKFLADKEAFWSKSGACPTQASYDGFDPAKIKTNGKRNTLKVHNPNGNKAEYKYRLRFEREDHTPESWDPVIENKNGPGHSHLRLVVDLVLTHLHLQLIAAAALVAAAAVGAMAMRFL